MIKIPDHLIYSLEEMINEMYENQLEVCFVPDPERGEGRCKRVACSSNVQWYKDLCSMYPDSRLSGKFKNNPRTIIKKISILRILKTLINKKCSRSIYADYLIDIAQSKFEIYERNLISWNEQF
ncbi:MAG: hypothetical protein GQ540_03965 [Lutibacter sp.]|uniref:hypothetical protein n=1 Tax=Lutibacter sp. TaxID=1925666 RepID=UPI0019DCA7FF|nr:hypothetical protein [Lutibacter sp.]NOR27670.1 hypothetical protein [Lutibacter sp.]